MRRVVVHHQLDISLDGVVVDVLGLVRLAEHSDERLLGVLVLNERVDADDILRLAVIFLTPFSYYTIKIFLCQESPSR